MAKKAKELSALAVSKLKGDGRYAVGGVDGLHLRIAGASRAWVLRIKIGSKRCDIGLGPFPEVSLADARDAAREHRKKVREGIDPLQERREARAALLAERAAAKTFKECAEAYIEANKAGWKNDKHVKQWSSTLETYAYPTIGELSVASVTIAHILNILEPIWATKTETASRLRGRIESVLDWAKVRGYRDGENPARWRGHLDKTLPARNKVQKVEHHAALPYAEVGAFMSDLRKRDGTSARALEFSILCASRSGEVRNAMWAEFDLKGRVWTIPADRMKAGKEHRVPLSEAAVALLKALPRVKGTEYAFPAPRGGPLSDMALTAVLKRMDRDGLTQHGFRSTFRDWAGETTAYPREVIEHALAHQLADKAEAAYQRGDLLAKRARLMKDWATYCSKPSKPGANVVAIKGGGVMDREAAHVGKLILAKDKGDVNASAELLRIAAGYLKARKPMPDSLADYLSDAFEYAASTTSDATGARIEHRRVDRLASRLGLKRFASRPRAIKPNFDLALTIGRFGGEISEGELARAIVEAYGVKESTARTWIRETKAELATYESLKSAELDSAK